MAFTFQIHDDMDSVNDQRLLDKAIKNTPKLIQNTVYPKRLVKLVPDNNAWGKFKAEGAKENIEDIASIVLHKDDQIILDLGDHYVGYFQVDILHVGSPMDAPLYLKVDFAEHIAELGMDPKDYDGWLSSSWISEERIHIDVLPATLKMPRRYSCRYIRLTVLNTSPKYGVSFTNPQFTAKSCVSYADVPDKEIEDPLLRKIDEIGIKTLHECMQEVFEDGPKRDRRLWLGDLRLQALANYYTFKNTELVKRCLYLFAGLRQRDGRISANVFTAPELIGDDTFLFDYHLFFISVLYDYYEFSKDEEVLEDLYPIAKKAMDVGLQYVDKDGCLHLDPNFGPFVDWSQEIDKDTAASAIVMYVLKQCIALMNIKNDTDIVHYQQTLDLMKNYVMNHYYDSSIGLFVSGPNSDVNIASQVWMVLSGVLDDDMNLKIMKNSINQLFPIRKIATPYMYHHIVEALFVVGLKDEAISLMKEYWGKMIYCGADTYWEAFLPEDPDFSPYGSVLLNSFCHAWSCTPTYLIRKFL